jgi:inner membrane protein involved in colicin E2 resistance
MVQRVFAIALVYLLATAGWLVLGTTIVARTDDQDAKLKAEVGQLWGTPLEQPAPSAELKVEREAKTEKVDQKTGRKTIERTKVIDSFQVPLVQSNIAVGLHLDQRQKGLLWYSTYRARFSADYTFENTTQKAGALLMKFTFPSANGLYDEFRFEVDGSPAPFVRQDPNQVVATMLCEGGATHRLGISYVSQGLDRFVYSFGNGISEVRNFKFDASTDFGGFDFPGNTISPTEKTATGNGWGLIWQYKDLITGNGIGVEMPQRINPGPMAARISFFAPVSLAFFFFLIFVISLLRGVDLHPMNYFFLAAAFFSFHLLLAYLVDHISIHAAFLICSVASIILTVSYIRLVVGNRFAFVESGLAQLIYLVGFSYAFFLEGFTGLAVTIGAILTLFVVMQLTGRINWTERFQKGDAVA